MSIEDTVVLKREDLYQELWEMSASGVAKKHNLNYGKLLTSCREFQIPIPPSGYWTKLACGKATEKIELPDSSIEEVKLALANSKVKKVTAIGNKEESTELPKTKESREIHEEIADINVEVTDFIVDEKYEVLKFLPSDEGSKVIEAIQNIKMENRTNLHPMLVAYRKKIAEWEKIKKTNESKGYYRNNSSGNIEPAYFKEVSSESMQRVACILDVLFRTVEKLGGKINDNLSMTIRKDIVSIHFAEGKDKVPHVMTKQEAQQMLIYKDSLKQHKWASEPRIRKYDEIYNGQLRVTFKQGKYFRDSEEKKLEDRLDEIIIQIYKLSEEYQIAREKREEEHRQYLEAERIREEKKKQYEAEIVKTKELVNQVNDYHKACEIRAYIQAVINHNELNEEIEKWVKWASEKADWFDPAIAKEDNFFGKREHNKTEEEKDIFCKKRYW